MPEGCCHSPTEGSNWSALAQGNDLLEILVQFSLYSVSFLQSNYLYWSSTSISLLLEDHRICIMIKIEDLPSRLAE